MPYHSLRSDVFLCLLQHRRVEVRGGDMNRSRQDPRQCAGDDPRASGDFEQVARSQRLQPFRQVLCEWFKLERDKKAIVQLRHRAGK